MSPEEKDEQTFFHMRHLLIEGGEPLSHLLNFLKKFDYPLYCLSVSQIKKISY